MGIDQFNQCIQYKKYTDDDIEDDIFLQYESSKIVKYLERQYKWKPQKTKLLYNSLSRLFGFQSDPNRSKNTYNSNDPNIIENYSHFSTTDKLYDEMRMKLDIEKKKQKVLFPWQSK